MMNDTVARIVDLMFENAEMTEEVVALRDEVMNNCQERYSDLIASGVPQDDAVAAVVESLKGMEDVIAQYSRNSRRTVQHTAGETPFAPGPDETAAGGEQELTFTAEEISRIDVALVNEDVELEASEDGLYHVLWNEDEDPMICARAKNGTLHICRLPGDESDVRRKRKIHVDARDGFRNSRVYVDGDEIHAGDVEKTMEGVSSMLENLGRTLGRMFSAAHAGFGVGDGVVIRIPAGAAPHAKLLTTSGDIEVTNVQLSGLNIVTTSGDVTLEMDEDEHLDKLEVRTTSGDIEATAYADCAGIGSTSGDVEVEGRIRSLTVNTVSGDIDVRADVERIAFKAISGDVDLEFDSDELREVQGSTISGDIDIDLPTGIGAIAISTNTRSGDVTTRYSTQGGGPTVTGSVSSMSGDITIR